MIKGKTVALGCYVLSLLQLERVLLARLRRSDAAAILNLHMITPEPNPFWPGLTPDRFDELLGYVEQHFDVVTLGELRGPRTSERPRLVLSFDDGYYNFLEYAAPLLERRGLRANQNVITGCVASGLPPWNIRLYDFLLAAPRSLVRELRVPGFSHSMGESDEAKFAYGIALSRHLKLRPAAERAPLFEPIEAAMNRLDFPVTRMLSADDVRALAKTHEIGTQSHSHESMGFENDGFFREDFERSARYFSEELGLPHTIYAFPNGSYRPGQIRYLLNHGIERVLLVDEQLASAESPVLPRLTFFARSTSELRLRALGWSPRGLAPAGPVHPFAPSPALCLPPGAPPPHADRTRAPPPPIPYPPSATAAA
jgi:peptidoglycan/xylan/chitin deacetylase (PgdA/CDA1 family)